MIIPIRCFTCGKLIADKWQEYEKLIKKLKEGTPENGPFDEEKNIISESSTKIIFEKLQIKRYCCKRILLSHVDMVKVIKNNKNNEYNYDNHLK